MHTPSCCLQCPLFRVVIVLLSRAVFVEAIVRGLYLVAVSSALLSVVVIVLLPHAVSALACYMLVFSCSFCVNLVVILLLFDVSCQTSVRAVESSSLYYAFSSLQFLTQIIFFIIVSASIWCAHCFLIFLLL